MPQGFASRLNFVSQARDESEQWQRYNFGVRDDSNHSDSTDSSSDSDSSDSDRSLLVLDSPESPAIRWDSDDASSNSSNHSNNSNHSEQSNHSNSGSDNSSLDLGGNQSDSDLPDIDVADSASSVSVALSWRSNIDNSPRRSPSPGSQSIERSIASPLSSDNENDEDEDFGRLLDLPGSPSSYADSRSNSNSSGNSSDSDDGFNQLRLSLPGTPSDRSPRSEHSNASEPENIFGDFMRQFGQRVESPLESPPTPRDPNSTTMVNNSRPSTSGTSTASSTISFECSVCLENLDAPASIGDAGDVASNNARNGNRAGPSSAVRRGTAASGPTNDTDIAATFCGHMYHQMCLEKWFQEQGKRTCPSCRKNVPKSKLIRLYPNISTDSSSKNGIPSAIPSSSVGAQASTSTSNPSPADGSCGRVECQDMKVIHNTLMNDYSDLQTRFDELRENDQLKEAQLQSLMEDNTRKNEEIENLKRSLEETRVAPSTSNGAKRRRH